MKILFYSLFLFLSFSASAQVQKGYWTAGGYANASYANSNYKANGIVSTARAIGLHVPVDGGYFFIDQLCAGIRGGIDLSWSRQESHTEPLEANSRSRLTDRSVGYSVGPFVRYYFLRSASRVNIFTDISYRYGHDYEKTTSFQSIPNPSDPQLPVVNSSLKKVKDHTSTFSLMAGPAFFINRLTALEAGIGYSYVKYSDPDLFSNNITLSVGLRIFFGKSSK